MLRHIKKFFGIKAKEAEPQAPYKVEVPSEASNKASEALVKSIKPKKETVKKPTTRKPRAPKKPKAE